MSSTETLMAQVAAVMGVGLSLAGMVMWVAAFYAVFVRGRGKAGVKS